MYEDEEYGFCPECGALMKNGVCISCGYDRNKKETDSLFNTAEENGELPAEESREVGAGDPAEKSAAGEGPLSGESQIPDGQVVYGGENASCNVQNPSGDSQNVSGGTQNPSSGSQNYGPQNVPYGAQNSPYGSQNTSYGPQNAQYGPQNAQYGPQNVPPYGQQGQQNVPPYGPQNGSYGMPGAQNGSYGTPYGQTGGYQGQIPPYPPYGAYPGGPQKRNNGRTLAAVIIAVIAVLLCIVLVLVYVIVRGTVKEAGSGLSNYKGVYGGAETAEPESRPEENGGYDEKGDNYGGYESEPEEEDYIPSPADDYYVTLADSIRNDLSYTVEWEEYDYVDDETGATTQGRYPQLKGGNIPHLDELNEEIKYEATYYSNLYGYYRQQQEEEDLYYASASQGYVTYMDEEKISIVLRESYAMNMESYISLYSINIDLVSGELMDNGQMIEYTPQLAEAFREQDAYQNGTAQAVEEMTDEQLQDFLSDSDTNIIFYTPVGLEIGFNYTTSTSSGWVTATIKEYERYMKKI